MPFVDLSVDNIRLFYRTNLPNDDMSEIARSGRETIVLLHPMFLSSEFLYPQFNDPILGQKYNLIAYDAISCGKTEAPDYISKGQALIHDGWVEAAVLALFCEALHLPPVHLFACQSPAVQASSRFASLFPEKVLSLATCSVPRQSVKSPDGFLQAWNKLQSEWGGAEDQDALDLVISELVFYMFEETMEVDELDAVVDHWYRHYAPTRMRNFITPTVVTRGRSPPTAEEFASIKCPTLIMQGSSQGKGAEIHPPSMADEFPALLTGVPGGATMEMLANAPNCPSLPRRTFPVVNKLLVEFFASASSLVKPQMAVPDDVDPLQRGLEILASLAQRPELAKRNPRSAFSFSRMDKETSERLRKTIIEPRLAEENGGFDPVDADGSIRRHYSGRSFFVRPNRPRSQSVVSMTTRTVES